MSVHARRIALLMLMLTLPFHGWALAFAPVCAKASSMPTMSHTCCAKQKACAEHKAPPTHEQKKSTACGDGTACQCSSAFSVTAQPFPTFASAAPAIPQTDFHRQIVYAQSAPPYRPPIHS